ncbi:unnamed protein product [Pleuronectes platessa]|uniref:Uncharacterized protein n=1 Tax=Pleuronectes platessa TaxID=8262 RepID=A0A9N7UVJ3_PLEPL|nr:unnamed protein product [Pleuronectes platessa]
MLSGGSDQGSGMGPRFSSRSTSKPWVFIAQLLVWCLVLAPPVGGHSNFSSLSDVVISGLSDFHSTDSPLRPGAENLIQTPERDPRLVQETVNKPLVPLDSQKLKHSSKLRHKHDRSPPPSTNSSVALASSPDVST